MHNFCSQVPREYCVQKAVITREHGVTMQSHAAFFVEANLGFLYIFVTECMEFGFDVSYESGQCLAVGHTATNSRYNLLQLGYTSPLGVRHVRQ